MNIKEIQVYEFSELSPEAQEKATIESVDSEIFIEDAQELLLWALEEQGRIVVDKHIYWDVDTGLSISGQFRDQCIIEKLIIDKFEQRDAMTLLYHLDTGRIEPIITLTPYRRGFGTSLDFDYFNDMYSLLPGKCRLIELVHRLHEVLIGYVNGVIDEAFMGLRKEYDYRQSREYTRDLAEANDYLFLEDGTFYR